MHKNEINHKASSLGEQINGAIFYALVSLIVLSPIPFGSNRAWSWSLCALIISFLSLAWIVNTVWNKRTVSLSLSPLIPVLFLVPCIWATLQASTFMPSAWSHPLWVLATDALNILILPSISITPDNGYTAWCSFWFFSSAATHAEHSQYLNGWPSQAPSMPYTGSLFTGEILMSSFGLNRQTTLI
jgi:hypothetical protein